MQARGKRRRKLVAAGVAAALGALAAPQAPAQQAGDDVVPLDRLLRLPSAVPVQGEVEKRGGASRAQWQQRFADARADLEAAEKALEETRAELAELAGDGAWTMSAPGLGAATASEAPGDFRLSQELRRGREEVDRAERALQELEVEANLAGVPEAWRAAPAAPAPAPAPVAAPPDAAVVGPSDAPR